MEAPIRIYITPKDVMRIFDCSERTGQRMVQDVNGTAEERGMHAFPKGKANKYIFAEKYNIPIDFVNQVIQEGRP